MKRKTKNKILVVADRLDLHADKIVEKLYAKNHEVFRFNFADMLSDTSCHWLLTDQEDMQLIELHGGHTLNLTEVKSALYRKINRVRPIENSTENEAEQSFIHYEVREFYEGIARLMNCFWINDPVFLVNSFWRMPQLSIAKSIGFNVPKSIVTNSPLEMSKFLNSSTNDFCIKRLTNTRVYPSINKGLWTTIINKTDYEEFANATKFCSTFVQEYIPKQFEIRLIVIGNKFFASKIYSQDCKNAIMDWRQGQLDDLKQEPYEISEKIKLLSLKLLKRLGLFFGAFDFIVTPDNNYYFLEVNPTGQWLWLENELGLQISDCFADYLINPPKDGLK